MNNDIQELITFSLSVLGAGLGVLNYWRDYSKDKVRLKVIPKRVIPSGGANPRINVGIEVINLSNFPLSVLEIGFKTREREKRMAIIQPITSDDEKYPFRLEPRSSRTVYAILEDKDAVNVIGAYASTACGVEKFGNSPALKGYVKKAQAYF